MRNKKRLIRKILIVSRLVIALTGFFVLFAENGLQILRVPFELENIIKKQADDNIYEAIEQTNVDIDTNEASERLDEDDNLTDIMATYTVRVNELVFTLGSYDDVIELLNVAKGRYDKKNEYEVVLVKDDSREIDALTAKIVKKRVESISPTEYTVAGVADILGMMTDNAGLDAQDSLAAFYEARESVKNMEGEPHLDLKLKELDFADDVEIAIGYKKRAKLSDIQDAIEAITQDKQKEEKYEVQSGDSLSLISLKTDIPMDRLIEINDSLTDENSTIRIGEELTITVPQPELSFVRVEQEYYEESYNAPIEYVDNDDWYTTDQKTLQDPIAGFHRVVADVTYRNDREESREIRHEEIIMDATPKIVERGTKIPPSFIKPISGGRVSSGFGKRSAPKKGASTYHKGIDWATPVGTAVWASSAGTVSRAGWGSGYGNVVYIDHADGRQTRYGHLSKVLVKPGQYVNQGDKIALSGNTGRSTGPHIHFELLINGGAVDPFKYLK